MESGENISSIFLCQSASHCTSDSLLEDREGCQPEGLREETTRALAVLNIVLVILLGGGGNLLTLLAILHCLVKHRARFSHLWSGTTVLQLHLSLCDLLYCVLGLPVFISVYHHGFLPNSEDFCRYSALFRNLFAYSGFLTMAAIATTRSLGCLLHRNNMDSAARIIFHPTISFVACGLIWLLAFAILSPITFSLTIGPYYFGTFGYDARHGKCEVINCQPAQGFFPGGFIFSIVFFVPFLLILVSHVFISFTLELERRRKEEILQNQSQVPFAQIQFSLLVLSGAYVAFALPVLIIENMELEDSGELVALCAYSWYWWMYASNFIIYIITLADFRRMYRQFFNDLFSKSFAFSKPWNSSINNN